MCRVALRTALTASENEQAVSEAQTPFMHCLPRMHCLLRMRATHTSSPAQISGACRAACTQRVIMQGAEWVGASTDEPERVPNATLRPAEVSLWHTRRPTAAAR